MANWHWIRENPSYWDEDKARIVGAAPRGVFDSRYRRLEAGDLVPGEWWRVEERGRTVAFGWLDVTWSDAEVLVATHPEHRSLGLGTWVLNNLDDEARSRGLNYLTNLVRPTHPERAWLIDWLERRGFCPEEDGRLVRRVAPAAA